MEINQIPNNPVDIKTLNTIDNLSNFFENIHLGEKKPTLEKFRSYKTKKSVVWIMR